LAEHLLSLKPFQAYRVLWNVAKAEARNGPQDTDGGIAKKEGKQERKDEPQGLNPFVLPEYLSVHESLTARKGPIKKFCGKGVDFRRSLGKRRKEVVGKNRQKRSGTPCPLFV
jgi:hypothetical protein